MPKIQQAGSNYTVNIPKEARELMKPPWNKGDTLMVDVDIAQDCIILKRIREE